MPRTKLKNIQTKSEVYKTFWVFYKINEQRSKQYPQNKTTSSFRTTWHFLKLSQEGKTHKLLEAQNSLWLSETKDNTEYLTGGKGIGQYEMFLHKNGVHTPCSAAQGTSTLECTSSTVAPESRTGAGKGQAPKY